MPSNFDYEMAIGYVIPGQPTRSHHRTNEMNEWMASLDGSVNCMAAWLLGRDISLGHQFISFYSVQSLSLCISSHLHSNCIECIWFWCLMRCRRHDNRMRACHLSDVHRATVAPKPLSLFLFLFTIIIMHQHLQLCFLCNSMFVFIFNLSSSFVKSCSIHEPFGDQCFPIWLNLRLKGM